MTKRELIEALEALECNDFTEVKLFTEGVEIKELQFQYAVAAAKERSGEV